MATATTTRRTRTAAQPEVQNVTTRRGGKVHRIHPATDTAFPACRTGSQTRLPSSRYVYTTAPVDCEKCLGTTPTRRAPQVERTPTGDPYKGKTSPRASKARRNGAAQDEAAAQAAQVVAEETAKVLAKRGTHAELNEQRKPGCSDDDYALAMRVRELRAQGRAWWSIGHELGLKGSGPSVKTGKTGAAHARRLWEKAWGPTYKDTSVPRETKAIKSERALTQPGKPYFPADEEELQIIAAVKGHEIEWVTRLGAGDGVVCSVQKAEVDGDKRIEIVEGPKGRVLKFYEVILDDKGIPLTGPLRSVYIDRIEKVGR